MNKLRLNKNLNFMIFIIFILIIVFILSFKITSNNYSKVSENSIAASGNWDNYRASGFAGGSGTSSNPWQINTAEQLAYMSYIVRNNQSYSAGYYKLTANIDLSEHFFTPIGYNFSTLANISMFNGEFDGQGYLIKGLTINGGNFVGLFAYLAGNAIVSNVSLMNVNIVGTNVVGAVCGACNGGTIKKCIVNSGTITNNGEYTGGIAGLIAGTIYDCYNVAAIYGARFTGGIVGRAVTKFKIGNATINGKITSGSIYYCYNTGYVSGTSSVGGICGNHDDSSYSLKVYKCYNRGSVKGTDAHVGGIVGYNGNANFNIYDCVNVGNSVIGKNYVGNIIGRNKDNNGYVSNCYYYTSSPKTAGTNGGSSDTVSHITSSGRQSTYLSLSNFYNFITSSTYSNYWKSGSWSTVWWKKDNNFNAGYPILYDLHHNLNFNKNGGSGGTSSIYCYRGALYPNISIPTKTGYRFLGYYSNSNGKGIKYYNSNGTSTNYYDYYTTKTLYALWTPILNKVNYNPNSGNMTNSSLLVSGTTQYDYVEYNEQYFQKRNLYDMSKSKLENPFSYSQFNLSSNVYTCTMSAPTSSVGWFNFNQSFSGIYEAGKTYTIVFDIISNTFPNNQTNIILTSTYDEGSTPKDVGTGQIHCDSVKSGSAYQVFKTWIVRNYSTSENLPYDLRSYVYVAPYSTGSLKFRIAIFPGIINQSNYQYVSYEQEVDNTPSMNISKTGYTYGWASGNNETR